MADNNSTIGEVSIEIRNNLYARFENQKNTPQHVLAEFIDNALQSYLDHKDVLDLDPNYKLRVEINFSWDERQELSSVTIKDNAAGMKWNKFKEAFTLAKTPDNTSGLNEFGMGMKTAALWLGYRYTVTSTAIGEDVQRTVCFDLGEVTEQDLRTLPVTEMNVDKNSHYTDVTICNFTNNAPTSKTLNRLGNNIASIYRHQLKDGEIEIVLNGKNLTFVDYPILNAPFVNDPNGQSIEWKEEIDITFKIYRAKGFIALLPELKGSQNGLVLMRRGRVIEGEEEEHRYFPKKIFGNKGNFRYKRLFGEFELEGFDVSFNKNGVRDTENLEALMDIIHEEIRNKSKLFTQADKYRSKKDKEKEKKKDKGETEGTSKPQDKPSAGPTPASNDAGQEPQPSPTTSPSAGAPQQDNSKNKPSEETRPTSPAVTNDLTESIVLDNTTYTMNVMLVREGNDLIWLNVHEQENVIDCKINSNHPFFKAYPDNKSAIAVLRAMAMAKFSAQKLGGDISAMFMYFNEYIRDIKA